MSSDILNKGKTIIYIIVSIFRVNYFLIKNFYFGYNFNYPMNTHLYFQQYIGI